jgi:DNA polymerase-1
MTEVTANTVEQRTQLPAPGDPETLYLIDLSSYVFRAYHGIPALSNSKGEPTNAVYGTTAMLQKLIGARKPVMLAVAMDSKTETFRKKEFEAYKANRPPPPPDLAQQMRRVQEIIEAYEIPVFQQNGVEADDLIATVVKAAKARHLKTVIVSADKDLLALIGPQVCMYDTMYEKVYGERETIDKLGVPPAQVPEVLALVGDTSDNIPGVPSVGPKTASALIREYGTVEGVFEHLQDIKRPALRQALETHRESVAMSRRLVTLHDNVDVTVDFDALHYTGGNEQQLAALFQELEFHRFLQQVKTNANKSSVATAALDAPPENPSGEVVELVATTLVQSVDELDSFLGTIKSGDAIVLSSIAHDGSQDLHLLGLATTGPKPSAVAVPTMVVHASRILKDLLQSDTIEKWSCNLKEEEKILAGHGIALKGGRFDCLLASYVLESERRSHAFLDALQAELGPEHSLVTEVQQRNAITLQQDPAKYVACTLTAIGLLRERWWPRLQADGLEKLFLEIELPLAHVLGQMETTGIRVDLPLLQELSKDVGARLQALESRCHSLGGGVFNINSPRQLEVILFDTLKLPALKKTKTGRSTDQSVLEELSLSHPLPETILECRKLSKLKGTYLDALPRQVNPETGRIHTKFNQAVAATGRLSSSDPNLQNIPIRDEVGREIRKAFIPEDGWLIFSADYSQIELRLLAHLSHDPQLVEAFQGAEDVHVRTARALFGVDSAHVTRQMRGQAKTVNFAVIYGQTDFALSRSLKIPRAEAARYIQAFFTQYAGVKTYLDGVVNQARTDGYVQTLFGRKRRLPDLRSNNRTLRAQAERMAFNTPIQGTAADVLKLAMISIQQDLERKKLRSRMLLTVHDELVFEVPPEEKQELEQLVRTRMQDAVALDVPLLVDVGWGKNWGEAH